MDKKELRSLIIGTVLGDSSLCGKKQKFLYIGHCESQKAYLEWKLETISSNLHIGKTLKYGCNMTGTINRQSFNKGWTTSHHKLTALYKKMYVDGKKRITKEVLRMFGPIGLAALYMDDGCKETDDYKGKRRIKVYSISLGGFPKEDVQLLSDWLYNNYGIESTIYLSKGKYPYLRIGKKDNREKFKSLVEPYIHNSMLYKI